MASTTRQRALALPLTTFTTNPGNTYDGILEFAVFIDTHRDQPHVATFGTDIHRGMCQPVLVRWAPGLKPGQDDLLIRATDGAEIVLDERHHKFVSVDWWRTFVLGWMGDHNGDPPVDGDGQMPTSHLRDARAKKYLLRSFRQIVLEHQRNP